MNARDDAIAMSTVSLCSLTPVSDSGPLVQSKSPTAYPTHRMYENILGR